MSYIWNQVLGKWVSDASKPKGSNKKQTTGSVGDLSDVFGPIAPLEQPKKAKGLSPGRPVGDIVPGSAPEAPEVTEIDPTAYSDESSAAIQAFRDSLTQAQALNPYSMPGVEIARGAYEGAGQIPTETAAYLADLKARSEEGYSVPETNALRDEYLKAIAQDTASAKRAQLAQQGRTGVSGGIAASQLSDIEKAALEKKISEEANLFRKNIEYKDALSQQYGAGVTEAESRAKAEKERASNVYYSALNDADKARWDRVDTASKAAYEALSDAERRAVDAQVQQHRMYLDDYKAKVATWALEKGFELEEMSLAQQREMFEEYWKNHPEEQNKIKEDTGLGAEDVLGYVVMGPAYVLWNSIGDAVS